MRELVHGKLKTKVGYRPKVRPPKKNAPPELFLQKRDVGWVIIQRTAIDRQLVALVTIATFKTEQEAERELRRMIAEQMQG